MKKNNRLVILIVALSVFISSCSLPAPKKDGQSADDGETNVSESSVSEIVAAESSEVVDEEPEPVSRPNIEPREEQIQYICQLATIECYYHNVAEATKEPGTGVSHWGETETDFWFEYSAQATLGVEAGSITMEFNGNHITVYMPHATILNNSINVEPDSTSDPVYAPHNWYTNDVEITAADVTEAMSSANEDIMEEILNDPYLLLSAERRAKDLIENYINQIMELSDTEYEVTFEFIDP